MGSPGGTTRRRPHPVGRLRAARSWRSPPRGVRPARPRRRCCRTARPPSMAPAGCRRPRGGSRHRGRTHAGARGPRDPRAPHADVALDPLIAWEHAPDDVELRIDTLAGRARRARRPRPARLSAPRGGPTKSSRTAAPRSSPAARPVAVRQRRCRRPCTRSSRRGIDSVSTRMLKRLLMISRDASSRGSASARRSQARRRTRPRARGRRRAHDARRRAGATAAR